MTKNEKEIAISFSEKRIGDYTEFDLKDNILPLVTNWWKMNGCTQEATSADLKILSIWIFKNYPHLTYTDIHLAIEWSVNGTIVPQNRPFIALSEEYVSRIINMYLYKKQELVQEILERQRNKQDNSSSDAPTPEKKMQSMKDMVISAYEALTKGGFFIDISDMTYKWLRRTNQFNPNDAEIKKAMEYGVQKFREKNKKEVSSIRSISEILAAGTGANKQEQAVRRYAREYIMKEYFNKVPLSHVLNFLKISDFK